jgi:hypothetical protein
MHYDLHPDTYHCPDHFTVERHHKGAIAAWALTLLVLVIALTIGGARLRAEEGRPQVTHTAAAR